MAPSTAASFLILSIITYTRLDRSIADFTRKAHLVLSAAVVLFGLLEAAGAATGLDLNLENTIVPHMGTVGGARVGLMSPGTGALFVPAGAAVFCLLRRSSGPGRARAWHNWAGRLGALTAAGGTVFLLGYLFGAPFFYGTGTVPVAFTTALAFCFLSVSVMAAAGRSSFPLRHFTGRSSYARLMRSFFPLFLAAIIAEGVVIHASQAHLKVNPALGAAVVAVLLAMIAGAVVSAEARRVGRSLDRYDKERRRAEKELAAGREKYRGLFNSIRDAILVADTERNIIDLNPAFTSLFGYTLEDLADKKTMYVYENRQQFEELGQALKENYGGSEFLKTVNYRTRDGRVFPGETGVYFLHGENGEVMGFIGLIRDVSERMRVEAEKEELIDSLQKALAEVKTLSGLLPICSSCKKVRDDEGYWQQIEGYIQEHSQAYFSHGICPDCADRLYGEYGLYDKDEDED